MSNFNEAYNKTMGHEGGYSNDPVDVGGETYKGISRIYNPGWEGWYIVDGLKDGPNFPDSLNYDDRLDRLVRFFYKDYYWDRFLGSDIEDQDIANELFDTAVNMGVSRASTFLQRALNLLNNNGKRYADISEDGRIGPNTLATLEIYLLEKPKSYLLKVLNLLQGNHYINYMLKDPRQEKYAFGWLNRVEINKIY